MSEGAAWEWRLLNFMRRSQRAPDPPPPHIVRLGFAAGALEGVIVGILHGGINCVILCILWGLIVGNATAILSWRVRRDMRTLVFSLLAGVFIEALGGLMIAGCAPFFAFIPLWAVAIFIIILFLVVVPVAILAFWVIYQGIFAAFRGLLAGTVIGAVTLTIVGGMLGAHELGTALAVAFGCIVGAVLGLFYGAIAGWFIGAFVGALITSRRTFLPTYMGLVSAITFGFTGWFIGGDIARDGGAVMGVMLGVPWGAIAGIAFGAFVTPSCWRSFPIINNTDPFYPVVFDMSDGRGLADFADTPVKAFLVFLLLGLISFRKRMLCLQPVGEEYSVSFDSSGLELDAPPTLAFHTGLEAIITLGELVKLGPSARNASPRQEKDLQVIVSGHRVNLHLLFEQTPQGERVTLTAPEDAGASDAIAAVARRLLFIMKARLWASPHGRPRIRFLRGIM